MNEYDRVELIVQKEKYAKKVSIKVWMVGFATQEKLTGNG